MNCQACDKVMVGRRRKYCNEQCRDKVRCKRRKRPADTEFACVGCGATFTGHKRKYCTAECGRRRYRPICETCGREWRTSNPSSRYCSAGCRPHTRPRTTTYICKNQECGKVFRPKAPERTDYCSRECAFVQKRIDGAEQRKATAVRRAAEPPKPVRPPNRYEIQCKGCNRQVVTASACQVYCSVECRERQFRTVKSWRTPLRQVFCRCGTYIGEFQGKVKGRRRVCAECLKQGLTACQHRRRARKRGALTEVFTSQEIFDRDGWRCGVCGKAVKRKAVAPHPMSPTLDHIVPLSKGGEHTRMNVQCAHFICNSRKGAKDGAQLRLIG